MAKRKPNGYWTLERCMEDASHFRSRMEWKGASSASYGKASRLGWLDRCCEHMNSETKPRGYWTLERCIEDAAQYGGVKEWLTASRSAYAIAHRKGWLEQCCRHMETALSGTANDVVYLWRDANTDLHKIGVTSAHIGEQRIAQCRRHNNMNPSIVFMLKVPDARAVESQLLKLGTDPELDSSIDGYTEFRVLSNEELGKAVSTAYQYAVAA